MGTAPRTVLIVGAGLAGCRCAEELRAGGFDGRILLVGAEDAPPYERPALSKGYLAGCRSLEDLVLRPAAALAERGIELLTGSAVVALDLRGRAARTADGRTLAWDVLVLATGVRARRLPHLSGPGCHHLRTARDAARLRGALAAGSPLTVLGAGLVGTEVASTANALGHDVTLVAPSGAPLERAVGRDVGLLLARRARAHGVRLVPRPSEPTAAPGPLLVAVGSRPDAASLVPSSLLAGDGGVATDACGRTAVPGVHACGDVASTWQPALGRHERQEHWTAAAASGAAVARTVLGDPVPVAPVPYWWSDVFGLRLQHVGRSATAAAVELEGGEDGFCARYRDRSGRLVAALAANRPRLVGALRRELAAAEAA